jgi:hypothetical protein
VSTRIYAPDGAVGKPPVHLAPSPSVLTNLRIGVLDNAKPNARLLMVRAAEQIAARTGARLTLVTDKGPGGNAATPCTAEAFERLVEEVDLVLTGSAD